MLNIKNLVKKDKWDLILKYIKQGKIDPLTPINNSILIHIASAKDKKDILKYISNTDPDAFKKIDKNGDTPLHILAKYGYYDTLYSIIKKDNTLMNIKNIYNKKISDIISFDGTKDSFKLLNVSNNDNNILLKLIKGSTKKGDRYYKILLDALKKNTYDLNVRYNNPLVYAIIHDKNHIIDTLLKYDIDINIITSDYISPLIVSVVKNNIDITKKLISKGADINYSGAENDYNPTAIAILNNSSEMLNLLLNNKPNLSVINRQLDTPLHIALIDRKLNISDIFRLIYKSDLNLQNINGDTPLHILLKKYDWKYFKELLKSKDLDINITNKKGKKPIDYIHKEELSAFMSIVKNPNIDNDKNKINLVTGVSTNIGIFNADAIHNIIYTILILDNYKNITAPSQKKTKIKYINDKYELEYLNLYQSKKEIIIADLQKIYTDFAYEIVPYLIIWGGKGRYHIHKDLDFYLNNALNNKNIRFVFMKITIVTSEKSSHANVLIYDKKTNIMERFEPYGLIPYVDNREFDIFLKTTFQKLIPDVIYMGPKELMGTVSFQMFSDDTNRAVKNLGDPYGYCLAWTYWYLEMRLANPDTNPKDMIKRAIRHILNTPSNKSGAEKFITFIRDYAKKLDNLKNKFMLNAGIKQKDLYNLVQNKDNLSKIMEYISKYLIKSV